MKLGQRTRCPITGKTGYVVRFRGEYAVCRDADGKKFKVLAAAPRKSPVAVRVNIYGVRGEYGGELVDKGRAVVITDGHPLWHGAKLQGRDASWERIT